MSNFVIRPVASWPDAPQIKTYSQPYRGFTEYIRYMSKNVDRNNLIVDTVIADMKSKYIESHSMLSIENGKRLGRMYAPNVVVVCDTVDHVNLIYDLFMSKVTDFTIIKCTAHTKSSFDKSFHQNSTLNECRIVITTKAMFTSDCCMRPYCAVYLVAPARSSAMVNIILSTAFCFNRLISMNRLNFEFRQFVDCNKASCACAADVATALASKIHHDSSMTHAFKYSETRLIDDLNSDRDKVLSCKTFGLSPVSPSWFTTFASKRKTNAEETIEQEEVDNMTEETVVETKQELNDFPLVTDMLAKGATNLNAAMYSKFACEVIVHSFNNGKIKPSDVINLVTVAENLSECLAAKGLLDDGQTLSHDVVERYNVTAKAYRDITSNLLQSVTSQYRTYLTILNHAMQIAHDKSELRKIVDGYVYSTRDKFEEAVDIKISVAV